MSFRLTLAAAISFFLWKTDDVSPILFLNTVGVEADADRVSKLISELEGKDINEVIESGVSKLASVPAGGAVASSGGAAPAAGGGGAAKEEAKKEEEEEEDADMGFSLFD